MKLNYMPCMMLPSHSKDGIGSGAVPDATQLDDRVCMILVIQIVSTRYWQDTDLGEGRKQQRNMSLLSSTSSTSSPSSCLMDLLSTSSGSVPHHDDVNFNQFNWLFNNTNGHQASPSLPRRYYATSCSFQSDRSSKTNESNNVDDDEARHFADINVNTKILPEADEPDDPGSEGFTIEEFHTAVAGTPCLGRVGSGINAPSRGVTTPLPVYPISVPISGIIPESDLSNVPSQDAYSPLPSRVICVFMPRHILAFDHSSVPSLDVCMPPLWKGCYHVI